MFSSILSNSILILFVYIVLFCLGFFFFACLFFEGLFYLFIFCWGGSLFFVMNYIVELFRLFIVSSFLSEGSGGENKTLLAKINFGYRPIEQLYLSSKEFCFKYIYYIHIYFLEYLNLNKSCMHFLNTAILSTFM